MKKDINKITITVMRIYSVILSIFYLALVWMSLYFIKEPYRDIAVIIETLLMFIFAFAGLYFETYFGFYECQYCHHRFVPTFKEVFLGGHVINKRKLRCPNCHEKSWAVKKVDNKKD